MHTTYEDDPKPARGKRGKSNKGLKGAEAGKYRNTGVELSKPLVVVGGLLVGNLTGKLIDKFIPVNADEKGFMKILKSSVKPLVQGGLGVGIILLSREKDGDERKTQIIKELARSFGQGVAGSGGVSVLKLVNKDLFAGLGDSSTKPIEAKYYTEAKDEIMKMLQDNSFKPALPEGSNMSSLPEMTRSEGLERIEDTDNLEGYQEAEII